MMLNVTYINIAEDIREGNIKSYKKRNMETYMMFGQSYIRNVYQVIKKKYVYIILLILIFSSILSSVLYFNNLKQRIFKELENLPPIVFSADFHTGEHGTFEYYPSNGTMDKVLDFNLYYPSYDKERKHAVGFVFNKELKGIYEFGFENKSLTEIIKLQEISTLLKGLGVVVKDFEDFEDFEIINTFRMPKYNELGYTFIYNDQLYLLYKINEIWDIKLIFEDDGEKHTYFTNEQVDNIYIEEEKYQEGTTRDIILKVDIAKNSSDIIKDTRSNMMKDRDGILDISDDGKTMVYYEKKNIFIYDTETGKKKRITDHRSNWKHILDLKLSEDKKYIFYTVVEEGFGISDADRRYHFYIADTESKTRIYLRSFDYEDKFYGFDW